MTKYTYEQISVYLTNLENFEPVLEGLDHAVSIFANDLTGTKDERIVQAKVVMAKMINEFRKKNPEELEPRDVLGQRPRAAAWAVAELFKVL